ncbi:hypothetical protein FQR65_LT05486 [Abscondita terminalis]|nr:hypothetical protein FQR65_LT05486 [Abscondita terminalis]
MYNAFLVVVVISVAFANYPVQYKCPCDRLAPLYNSFGCRTLCMKSGCVTKYDCSNSPYIKYFDPSKCYYRGKFYNISERLPVRLPDQYGIRECSWVCKASSTGTYWSPCNCIYKFTSLPKNVCNFDALYNYDYFHSWYVPIYDDKSGINCPVYWSKPWYTNYTTNRCSKLELCCHFGNNMVARYDNITSSYNLRGTCDCPPLLTGLVVGKQ